MTETAEWSIAEAISRAQRPQDETFALAGKAADLQRAIKVAEQWIEAAAKSPGGGEMWERAETIHDELEEELSRVAWEMEIASARRREEVFNEGRPEERKVGDPEAVARASHLSESLMEAYSILAGIPQEHLALCGSEASPRTRHRLMGALLAAREAADAELGRLDPHATV